MLLMAGKIPLLLKGPSLVTSPDERFTDSMVDLVERERIAVNETFAAHGLAWNWSPEVHNSLRRVGGIKRQFDEYGFRTGDLLTYQQLVLLLSLIHI